MFEDDRGRLLQIAEWVDRLKDGFTSRSELANEVIWWRLSRIEQCCKRLSVAYNARHPQIAALGLPTMDQVLTNPSPPIPLAAALARRAIDTFEPLLASLPPPPPPRSSQPTPSSRHLEIISKLKTMEPQLRERGLTSLYVFGSVARREDGPDSDVDLTFGLNPEGGAVFSLWDQSRVAGELTTVLNSKVDLVEWESFHDDVRERVRRDMVRIFGELCA